MHYHYRLLSLLFVFFVSCQEQETKKAHPETIAAITAQKRLPAEDPYFVLIKDTISMHGPHSITRNMLQDKKGIFWFASWEGIVSYDSKQFTNHTLKKELRHFHVFSVLEDKTGEIWFGTIGGGIYCYDGQSFKYLTKTDGLAGNVVIAIHEDQTGNIWFGTNGGVSRYDGKTFTNFTMSDGLSSNFINTILQDKTGKLWFGSNGGVSFYDSAASLWTGGKAFISFLNENGAPFNNVRSMIEDKSGNLWIGCQDGLWRYSPSVAPKAGRKSITNITQNFTGYLFEDKAGNIWLSEARPNGSGMIFSRYDGRSFTKMGESNQFFGITEDKNGNIWCCTERGIRRYNKDKTFTTFQE